MASHRSTDDAPADDQAFAEAFDEEKTPGDRPARRPDEALPGAPDLDETNPAPLDEVLSGSAGERFGARIDPNPEATEAARQAPENETDAERRRRIAAEEGVALPAAGPDAEAQGESSESEDARAKERRINEAMDETFPASDPPSWTPGAPD